MKVHIVGAGAIGGIVAAHLVPAGHDVTVVDANEEHVEAIKQDGLTLTGHVERGVAVRALHTSELDEPLSTVLLAVKARHTEAALEPVAPLLTGDGYVVSLQNGLEEAKIGALVGPDRVVGSLLTFGGYYASPGVIHYMGPGTLLVGEMDGRPSARTQELADTFTQDFHQAEATGNIAGALWSKAAIGAAYIATALVDEDVPVIFGWTEYRPMFEALVAEVAGVAAADGVRCVALDGFDPAVFTAVPRDAARADAAWKAQQDYWHAHGIGRTGVWRDLAVHRRQTEVDQIVGPVVALAREQGRDVPLLAGLLDLVHGAEQGTVERGTACLDHLASLMKRTSA
ncbi:ketopantoate reductase family protein [Actinomadura sp. 1N219]|uniref:ketopantoate reductase family protein n=1 Tax=Actinomadura sp. 1N219 TaxID=3375152 RepID=UPI00378AFAA6